MKEKKDICNVCGKPFIRDTNGEWVNHGHKLPAPTKTDKQTEV